MKTHISPIRLGRGIGCSLLSLSMLLAASCSDNDAIDTPALHQAIGFDGAFVSNASRAEVNTANIDHFDVYGYMTLSVDQGASTADNMQIFNAQSVDRTITTDAAGHTSYTPWTYSPEQFWLPGRHYQFVAIAASKGAPSTFLSVAAPSKLYSTDWLTGSLGITPDWSHIFTAQANVETRNAGVTIPPSATGTNYLDATNEVLYATALQTTAEPLTQCPAPLNFEFHHAMARVRVKFEDLSNANLPIGVAPSQYYMTYTADPTFAAYKKGSFSLVGTTPNQPATGVNWTIDETAGTGFLPLPTAATLNATAQAAAGDTPAVTSYTTDPFYLIPGKLGNVTLEMQAYRKGAISMDTDASGNVTETTAPDLPLWTPTAGKTGRQMTLAFRDGQGRDVLLQPGCSYYLIISADGLLNKVEFSIEQILNTGATGTTDAGGGWYDDPANDREIVFSGMILVNPQPVDPGKN